MWSLVVVLILIGIIIGIITNKKEESEKKNAQVNNLANEEAFKNFNVLKSKTVGEYTFLVTEGYKQLGVKYNFDGRIEAPTKILLKDLDSIEILKDNITVKESGVGRAVVGGILAGGAGAIVGATTANESSKTDKITIKFTIKDINNPIYKVDVYLRERDRGRLNCQQVLNQADELMAMLDVIKADLGYGDIENQVNEKDFEEKLLKLANLKNNNVITQEEFEEKKREIMDRI